ncbi:hypothetical protein Agabi119p4_1735 [Agaricus bisporus var. burnettii]|uniref:DUF300-domain-containing protein n=1 Tax=Agaricus bisporus var. burnettii TaxID=192524 RepID=A0A8H7F7V8_AGABI|nr:hypothetical protein Agabi119p4_1735 [Agaricus bisporus var. burnettii]
MPPSLFQNGNIVIQAHHVGWIVTGCFTVVATIASFWLVNKHLQWYTNKKEQRYTVRILFMVPLYAIISLASYLWWNHATPLILIRDCYEATVLTAFFYLLLMFLSPDPDEQRLIFLTHGLSRHNDAERMKKGEPVQKWVFPLWFVKWKPVDGLYFLQLMKWGILQYCVLRPLTTLTAIILDYVGLYCESSWGLGWGHLYITLVVSLSVTIAMYCLIQLYVSVSKKLAKQKPLLKLFAIKAVVFLTFWQATFLSVLTMFGVVKDTEFMTAEDINIGIGALLETFEMALFAFLHIRAFTYIPYRRMHEPNSGSSTPKRTPRLKSLGHAMDFRETFRELWAGCVYMWHKSCGKEPLLDKGAVRTAYYETAFGKQRPTQMTQNFVDERLDDHTDRPDLTEPTLPKVLAEVDEHVEVDVDGEKQWLGVGENYGYGLKFLRKERSETLEKQIENELQKRGYTLRNREASYQQHPKHPKDRSWWHSIRDRFSPMAQEEQLQMQEGNATGGRSYSENRAAQFQSKRLLGDRDASQGLLAHADVREQVDVQDLPPQSYIRTSRHHVVQSVDKWRRNIDPNFGTVDVLTPLPVSSDNLDGRHLGHSNREWSVDTSQPLVSRLPATSVDPDNITPVGPSKPQLEDISKSVLANPAQLEISSDSGRLAKPTVPVCVIPSQSRARSESQQGVAIQQPSNLLDLADEDPHRPQMEDAVEVRIYNEHEREQEHSATRLHAHRRESALHRPQSRTVPSTRSAPHTNLRRSSAQYGHPSYPKTSHPSSISASHSSPRRWEKLRQTRRPGGRSQEIQGTVESYPFSTSSLMDFSLSPVTPASTSPINGGLSRYSPHTSSTRS